MLRQVITFESCF